MAEQEQTGVVSWLPRVDARVVDAMLALGLTVASLTTFFLSEPTAGSTRRIRWAPCWRPSTRRPSPCCASFRLAAFAVLGGSVIAQSLLGYPLSGLERGRHLHRALPADYRRELPRRARSPPS